MSLFKTTLLELLRHDPEVRAAVAQAHPAAAGGVALRLTSLSVEVRSGSVPPKTMTKHLQAALTEAGHQPSDPLLEPHTRRGR